MAEDFFEFHQTAPGAGFDCSERFAQLFGNFALGETAEKSQFDNSSLLGGELTDRAA